MVKVVAGMRQYDIEVLEGDGRTTWSVEPRAEQQPGTIHIPADLRDWVSPATLKEWVDLEIAKLNWQHPGVAEYIRAHTGQHPRSMLALLAFAYAGAVFGSEEIVQACRGNRLPPSNGSMDVPFAQELRNFRRSNRRLLEEVLSGVFLKAITARLNLDPNRPSTELLQDLRDRAMERLDIARHMDAMDC